MTAVCLSLLTRLLHWTASFTDWTSCFLSSLLPFSTLDLRVNFMLWPTVSRPVSLGIKHPFGAYDQIFITCVTVTVLILWGALSDERTGPSFIYAGPCQSNLSLVRVPWDSQPCFTVSELRLPFSSPPTTRRVTVEVFDPASTRGTSGPFTDCSPFITLYSLHRGHHVKLFRCWLNELIVPLLAQHV
jgi:hypothetical protein